MGIVGNVCVYPQAVASDNTYSQGVSALGIVCVPSLLTRNVFASVTETTCHDPSPHTVLALAFTQVDVPSSYLIQSRATNQ